MKRRALSSPLPQKRPTAVLRRVRAPPLPQALAAERIVQKLVRSASYRRRRLNIRESFRSETSGPPPRRPC